MFTGIVVDTGTVHRARERSGALRLEVEAPAIARELRQGDSVAVNGVCLTATEIGRRRFSVHVMGETLALSNLGSLDKRSIVNLELPARVSDRLGGHIVQGHVDGIASVVRIESDDGAQRVWFEAGAELLRYMVHKGSVMLDGVSLTLVEVGSRTFQVALIPHTLAATTLGSLGVGSKVNVEVDVIAKYVERLVTEGMKDAARKG
jgi:riboflavin synthase